MEINSTHSYFIGKFHASVLLYLSLIEFIENGVYRIELKSKDGSRLNTICRVSDENLGDNQIIHLFNFDSADFENYVSQGLIYTPPICNAIDAFHKAQSTNHKLDASSS